MFDKLGYVKSRRQLRRLIGAVREHLHEQPGWRQRVNGIDSATATVDQICSGPRSCAFSELTVAALPIESEATSD